jgi:hypothetical protein
MFLFLLLFNRLIGSLIIINSWLILIRGLFFCLPWTCMQGNITLCWLIIPLRCSLLRTKIWCGQSQIVWRNGCELILIKVILFLKMSFVLLLISNLLMQRKFNAQNLVVHFWTSHNMIAFRCWQNLFLAENRMHALYFLEESSQFRFASTFISVEIKN